jgi:hypothetical protein
MKRLIQFFRTPSTWLQNAMALNTDGELVNLNEFPSETKIQALSLHGAVAHLFSYEREPERRQKVMDRLSKAIRKHTGKSYFVAEYNNLPTTTFEDIKTILKIADQ